MVKRLNASVRALGLVGLLFALACAADELPRTQLVLVVTSELAPGELTSLELLVADRDDVLHAYPQEVTPSLTFPVTLTIVHDGGPLGPVRVGVRAKNLAGLTHERIHSVKFERGRTLVVQLDLAARCYAETNPCAPRVCTRSGCSEVELRELDRWKGAPPTYDEERDGTPFDAGVTPDSGSTAQHDAGADDGEDGDDGHEEPTRDAGTQGGGGEEPGDDAGTESGEEDAGAPPSCGAADLRTDPNNCGMCGYTCSAQTTKNSATIEWTCASGECVYECVNGRDDCDGKVENGCEVNLLTDKHNCGMCGRKCKGPRCVDGVCMGGAEG